MSIKFFSVCLLLGLLPARFLLGQTYSHIETLINQGQYQKAQTTIQHLLPSAPKKTELWWLLGVAHIALEQNQKALDAFHELLKESPDFFPEGQISPKIQAIFSKAQRQSSEKMPFLSVKTSLEGSNAIFFVNLNDYFKPLITQAIVYVRTAKEPYYLAYPMEVLQGSELRAVISASDSLETILYYIAFIGRFGKPFYYLGHSGDPFKLSKAAHPKDSQNDVFPEKKTFKREGLLLFGSAAVIGITFLFGLLKIGPSI